MRRFAIAATIVVAVGSPARADQSTGQAAYAQAEALAKQGKWADACPLYEASFKADPQLGALVHLADCHERIGKTATAWGEWNDAAALAHSRNDNREALAKSRADALAGKLARLHLNPPKQLIPGLVVKRDGADITILVGTDIPIDPGEHELSASAAGYVDWKTKVTVAAASATAVEIPVLARQVEVAPPPVVHEGTVKITTLPDAQILIDSNVVGKGSYDGKLPSGGHTLRVVAGGMRPYQSELIVADGQTRAVDVPLEKEAAAMVVVPPVRPVDHGPSFAAWMSTGIGVKIHGDQPLVDSLRAEIGVRIGARTHFGVYAQYGEIAAGNTCGYSMPGPLPMTEFDFGPRNKIEKCRYIMPGLVLTVHIRPKQKIDPFVALSPGFRFGTIAFTPYFGGAAQPTHTSWMLAIVSGLRGGVDYHPSSTSPNWTVGGFLDAEVTIVGDDTPHYPTDQGSDSKPFLSLFGGLRTGVAF